LHWSWALSALALVPLLGGAGPLVLLASTAAAFRGRRRQRDDLDAGADLGHAARARLTPLDAARRATGRLADRRSAGYPRAARDALLLGRDGLGRAVGVPFSRERAGHALVVGATGSGKTVTQTLIAEAAVEDGRAVIVVDPK